MKESRPCKMFVHVMQMILPYSLKHSKCGRKSNRYEYFCLRMPRLWKDHVNINYLKYIWGFFPTDYILHICSWNRIFKDFFGGGIGER